MRSHIVLSTALLLSCPASLFCMQQLDDTLKASNLGVVPLRKSSPEFRVKRKQCQLTSLPANPVAALLAKECAARKIVSLTSQQSSHLIKVKKDLLSLIEMRNAYFARIDKLGNTKQRVQAKSFLRKYMLEFRKIPGYGKSTRCQEDLALLTVSSFVASAVSKQTAIIAKQPELVKTDGASQTTSQDDELDIGLASAPATQRDISPERRRPHQSHVVDIRPGELSSNESGSGSGSGSDSESRSCSCSRSRSHSASSSSYYSSSESENDAAKKSPPTSKKSTPTSPRQRADTSPLPYPEGRPLPPLPRPSTPLTEDDGYASDREGEESHLFGKEIHPLAKTTVLVGKATALHTNQQLRAEENAAREVEFKALSEQIAQLQGKEQRLRREQEGADQCQKRDIKQANALCDIISKREKQKEAEAARKKEKAARLTREAEEESRKAADLANLLDSFEIIKSDKTS